MADVRPSDELASTILNLTMSENAIVATRGLDLFVAASCRELST